MLALRRLALFLPLSLAVLLFASPPAPAEENSTARQVELKPGDRIVFFGDSLTNLAGEEQPKEHVTKGYVRIVRETLQDKYQDKKIEVDWVATGGHTVPDLLERVERDVIAKKPTIVVIQIGCNDARRIPKETFQSSLEKLHDTLMQAGIQVVQCSLTSVGEKHDGTNPADPNLDEFAQVEREVAQAKNIPLIDLRKAFVAYWKEHNPDNQPSGVLTYDGNHFNQKGHEFVAAQMLAKFVGAGESPIPPPKGDDMRRLFNGQDLTGWDGDSRLWSVKDEVIRGETTSENPAQGNTFLIWKEGVTKDFDLRLSFRCSATNNSGIQYRSKHITEGNVRNKWVVRGYQHEIRNEKILPNVAGFIYDEGGRRGRLCLVGEKATWGEDGQKQVTGTLIDAAGFEELFELDDWNDVVIVAQGNRLRHYLNNRLIVDFTDHDSKSALSEGILALQLHAGAPMWVEFKDLRLREIAPTSPAP